MKIRRIELEHFRQFYGKQCLDLSVDPKKNVTLVHAENTYGKTTLLNAVLWALFEQVTKKFERPDDIVNHVAVKEGAQCAEVGVEFDSNDRTYFIKRVFNRARVGNNKSDVKGFEIIKGDHKPLTAPATLVESIMPPEMAKYFFFDGEAAENYSCVENFRQISQAVRNILGCHLAERAVADLQSHEKTLTRQIGQHTSDSKLKEIEESLARVQGEIEATEKAISIIKDNSATYRENLNALEGELRTLEAAKQIQEQRDDKKGQLKRVTESIDLAQRRLVEWLAKYGTSLVSSNITNDTLSFIDSEATRGKIPSPYNEEFVRGLLEAEKCICGTPLTVGSASCVCVMNLLKNAATAETAGRVVKARSLLTTLAHRRAEANAERTRILKEQSRHLEERNRLEQQIEELGKKLETSQVKDIASKERRRQEYQRAIDKTQHDLGGLQGQLAFKKREKVGLETQLEELARKDRMSAGLLRKRELVVQSSGILGTLLKQYEEESRSTIQRKINEVLDTVSHRARKCRLKDDFSLELVDSDNRPLGKSGGENQLLSLVFLASLVQFAESRIGDEKFLLKPGTVAPLVLDSPFGQLDTQYRVESARYIPAIAPQVLLLVTTSQGDEKVLEALAPYIGREYVLIAENAEPKGSRTVSKLSLNGREIKTAAYSCERTLTRIERIR